MSWFSIIVPCLIAGALLFLPGLAVGVASRLKGFMLVALAPVVSATLIAVAAILAPIVGMRWSLLPVILLTVAVTAVAVAVTWWVYRGQARTPADSERTPVRLWVWLSALVAVAISAFLIGRRILFAFGSPDSFSQTFDNVFHLNALRYIADTGSGSSADLLSMTGSGFYPAAWHDLVSLVAQLAGTESPVAINATNLLIGTFVWSLGCIFLAQQIFGKRPLVYLAAGVLAAGFGAFPLLMLDYGVLYPNFFGNAMLPAVFGLLINALGLARTTPIPKIIAWLLVLATVPGLMLAHPNSGMTLLALVFSPLLFLWVRRLVTLVKDRSGLFSFGMHLAILAIAISVVILAWVKIRPPKEAATWEPVSSSGGAIGDVLASSAIGRPAAWLILVLTVIGIAYLVQNKRWWLLGSYLTLAALYIIVASFPFSDLRSFFTGVWYNDSPRLAALLPIITLPIAVAGVIQVWTWLSTLWGKVVPKSIQQQKQVATWIGAVASILALALLVVGTQRGNVQVAALATASSYKLTNDSRVITTDEMAVLERLDETVPEDALLIGNPYNGSALAYAFADRRTLQLHMLSFIPADGVEVGNHLNQAMTDPDVCPAVQNLNIGYVLDFGRQEIHGGDNGFRGLDNLLDSGVAELVDSQGTARVFRITACQ